jgi:hypothetical protein
MSAAVVTTLIVGSNASSASASASASACALASASASAADGGALWTLPVSSEPKSKQFTITAASRRFTLKASSVAERDAFLQVVEEACKPAAPAAASTTSAGGGGGGSGGEFAAVSHGVEKKSADEQPLTSFPSRPALMYGGGSSSGSGKIEFTEVLLPEAEEYKRPDSRLR